MLYIGFSYLILGFSFFLVPTFLFEFQTLRVEPEIDCKGYGKPPVVCSVFILYFQDLNFFTGKLF